MKEQIQIKCRLEQLNKIVDEYYNQKLYLNQFELDRLVEVFNEKKLLEEHLKKIRPKVH